MALATMKLRTHDLDTGISAKFRKEVAQYLSQRLAIAWMLQSRTE
jgi:hypothetical protein